MAVDVQILARARQAIAALEKLAPVAAAYLFGSHVQGTPDRFSDIDLGVFLEHPENWNWRQRAQTSSLIQKELGDDLELHYFSAEALRHQEPASFSTYVIKHGVAIKG